MNWSWRNAAAAAALAALLKWRGGGGVYSCLVAIWCRAVLVTAVERRRWFRLCGFYCRGIWAAAATSVAAGRLVYRILERWGRANHMRSSLGSIDVSLWIDFPPQIPSNKAHHPRTHKTHLNICIPKHTEGESPNRLRIYISLLEQNLIHCGRSYSLMRSIVGRIPGYHRDTAEQVVGGWWVVVLDRYPNW